MSCLQCGKSTYGESGALCSTCRAENHQRCYVLTQAALDDKLKAKERE